MSTIPVSTKGCSVLENRGLKHRDREPDDEIVGAIGLGALVEPIDGRVLAVRVAVHIVFAGEPVKQDYAASAPTVEQHDATGDFRVIDLEALVRMKLTSYRRKDQVHLLDTIEVGLIDETWPGGFGGTARRAVAGAGG